MAGFDAVEYLSLRLYPAKAVNRARAEVSDGKNREVAEDYVRSADIYEKALHALSQASLNALADDERQLEVQQIQEQAQGKERNQFFNRQDAKADFGLWAEQSCWSLDETTALILGKNPKVVDWDQIEPLVHTSAFAEQFADIRRHLNKARRDGQLMDPVRPGHFLSWANVRGVVLPAELEACLEANAKKRADPSDETTDPEAADDDKDDAARTADAGVCAARSKPTRRSQNTGTVDDDKIIHLGREESRLRAMHQRMQAVKGMSAESEQETLSDPGQAFAKLVVAMAVGRYGYRPHRGRQSSVTDIIADLEEVGLKLSKSAVRRLLEQACTSLPAEIDREFKEQRKRRQA